MEEQNEDTLGNATPNDNEFEELMDTDPEAGWDEPAPGCYGL